jgi:hypothetical protein
MCTEFIVSKFNMTKEEINKIITAKCNDENKCYKRQCKRIAQEESTADPKASATHISAAADQRNNIITDDDDDD